METIPVTCPLCDRYNTFAIGSRELPTLHRICFGCRADLQLIFRDGEIVRVKAEPRRGERD